jgi:parallel beta-helix repeat protein
LEKGVYQLNEPLRMPGSVTLAGQGISSVLVLAPQLTGNTIVNADSNMHDVTIRDLFIEGATNPVTGMDPNDDRRKRSYMNATSRGGILFLTARENQIQHIRLEHMTIRNCTKNGVFICGAADVVVDSCDFSDNGSSVVPGAGFHHNLHLTHITDCIISNSRFDTSPWGSGIDLSFCRKAVIFNNEAARNKLSGIRCTESENISVTGNLTEGNDENGISFDVLMNGSRVIAIQNNLSRNNGLHGIYTDKVTGGTVSNNIIVDNGSLPGGQ